MVDGARVSTGYALPPLSLLFDQSVNTLEVLSNCDVLSDLPCSANPERVALVSSLTVFHLTGAYTFDDIIEAGLSIPIVYAVGDGIDTSPPHRAAPIGGSSGGIADPRLSAKWHFFGDPERDRYALAALAWITLPLGQATADRRYVGDDHPAFGGHLIGELFATERLRLAANLGLYDRPERVVVATGVGTMMSYAVAGEYVATDLASLVSASVLAEVTGSTLFGNQTRIDQLEGRIAGRVGWEGLYGTIGVGAGLILGPGVPDFRFLLGVGYAPRSDVDTDGDGRLDRVDACPIHAEDLDGFSDEDGCPEEDNDGDGIADAEDQCKEDAEDEDEHEDEDGCPELDNDGDGVRDGWDSCPNTAEDIDGDRDSDGCPESDRDGDGVDDQLDQCPTRPEDTDGLGDADGCPERDHDEDRVPDDRDECPEDAEDRDRFEDRDGCPEPGGRIEASPSH
jgi:hypothetical protein